MKKVVVVDLGAQNLFSISAALERVGVKVSLVSQRDDWPTRVDHVVLPGVGSFESAMKRLETSGIDQRLIEHAASGRPILGICLGAQLLLSESFEFGHHVGLGLIPGSVQPLDNRQCLVPHIGWCPLEWKLDGKTDFDGSWMYFNHSFQMVPTKSEHALAWCRTGSARLISAVGSDQLLGLQFHPEKSGPQGLRLLSRLLTQV